MRLNSGDWRALVALALGLLTLATARPRLVDAHRRITLQHDVYLLPPAEQTRMLSLGYRAALADLIFGHVLVSAGIHLTEKRLFEFADLYLDAINELDPKFRDPYRYADALLTLQSVRVPEETYRKARKILLRGTEAFPYDQALWASAGQFLAYLAPAQLNDPKEASDFKREGARLLARACELIGKNENIPYHCVTAAALFSEAGNRASAQAFLEKLLVVSDDPEIRELAQAKLAAMGVQAQTLRFEQLRREDLPFVSHEGLAALGPRFDPAACAGKGARDADEACATSFRERLAEPE
ncbi:MAG TPA: hypothetical protein VHP33_35445 [Polyangiaceae bacterium]|nr:hypothetical protein [Polyangiaceae bacterium]